MAAATQTYNDRLQRAEKKEHSLTQHIKVKRIYCTLHSKN